MWWKGKRQCGGSGQHTENNVRKAIITELQNQDYVGKSSTNEKRGMKEWR